MDAKISQLLRAFEDSEAEAQVGDYSLLEHQGIFREYSVDGAGGPKEVGWNFYLYSDPSDDDVIIRFYNSDDGREFLVYVHTSDNPTYSELTRAS